MINKLFQRLNDRFWEIFVMFIGWVLIFLLDLPITFLTVFIVTLLGYVIGNLLSLFHWQRKNDAR